MNERAESAIHRILLVLAESKVGSIITRWGFSHMASLMPVNKLYETDLVLAFYHPKPTHKVHILIVPKREIESFLSLTEADTPVVNDIIAVAQHLAQELHLAERGFRLLVNGGAYQDIKQLHFHLISDASD
jgi:histidine triad (HIT) family protein